jgi:hypothetical protein
MDEKKKLTDIGFLVFWIMDKWFWFLGFGHCLFSGYWL